MNFCFGQRWILQEELSFYLSFFFFLWIKKKKTFFWFKFLVPQVGGFRAQARSKQACVG